MRKTAIERPAVRGALVVLAGVLVAVIPFTTASANPGVAEPGEFEDLPPLELVLARYIDALGGEEAIRNLDTRVSSMRIVTDLKWDPPVYEVDSLSVHGNASGEFLVVTRTSDGVMLEGCDGDEEWKIDFEGKVFDFHAKNARDRWMTDPQFPLKLPQYFPDMEVVGLDFREGDWLYIVDVDGDESHRVGFDVETGLLRWFGYHREFRDYEEVDGVMMPRRVIYERKGGSSTFIVDAMAHNVDIDETLFSLPK
jgi:hypothetical protein